MSDFLWLLPSVTTSVVDDHLVLLKEDARLSFSPEGETLYRTLLLLDGDHTEEEVREHQGGPEILDAVGGEKWIVRMSRRISDTVDGRPEISRQLAYLAHLQPRHPDQALEEVSAARVAVVGMGGVGSHVVQALAGAGVGRFLLMDSDVVERSNLNRQFFYRRRDVGRSKVEAAAQYVRDRHPRVRIDTRSQALSGPEQAEVFAECSLIVFAGDGWTLVNGAPAAAGVRPVLMGGYIGATGVVGPMCDPSRGSACWKCRARAEAELFPILTGRRERPHGWNASSAPLNGVVGNLLAEAALRALAPSLGKPLLLEERLLVDLSQMRLRRVSVERVECPHVSQDASEVPPRIRSGRCSIRAGARHRFSRA